MSEYTKLWWDSSHQRTYNANESWNELNNPSKRPPLKSSHLKATTIFLPTQKEKFCVITRGETNQSFV